jgi:prolyl 4-hydroxylase
MNEEPFITVIQNALSKEQCERVISLFGHVVTRSLVGVRTRSESNTRTSSSFKIERLPEDVELALSERVATISRLPASHQETWELIRYNHGEKFDPHYDSYTRQRRLFSVVVYLISPVSGGETVFPLLNRSIAPIQGTLVAWPNYKNGRIIEAALHGSSPVISGVKWALVTWVRAVSLR